MVWNDSKVAQDTTWKKQRLTGRASHLIEEAVDLSKADDPLGPSLKVPSHWHDQA
jgi:hypothetical protein